MNMLNRHENLNRMFSEVGSPRILEERGGQAEASTDVDTSMMKNASYLAQPLVSDVSNALLQRPQVNVKDGQIVLSPKGSPTSSFFFGQLTASDVQWPRSPIVPKSSSLLTTIHGSDFNIHKINGKRAFDQHAHLKTVRNSKAESLLNQIEEQTGEISIMANTEKFLGLNRGSILLNNPATLILPD